MSQFQANFESINSPTVVRASQSLAELRRIRFEHDFIHEFSGTKHGHFAFLHCADDQKRCFNLVGIPVGSGNTGAGLDMPIAMGFVYVRLAEREDAILQHSLAGTVHDANTHTLGMIFPVDDAVGTVIGEKVGPFFQPVVVDRVRIVRDQGFDPTAHIRAQVYRAFHRQSPMQSR